MADSLTENLTETASNGTAKASTEGMAVAYTSLIVMALIPIFFGAFRSVKCVKKQKESGEEAETMSYKDAATFPIMASGALLGLYIFFKLFSKEYINLLITVYFFGLGVSSLTYSLRPLLRRLLPNKMKIMFLDEVLFDVHHTVVHTRRIGNKTEEMLNLSFTNKDLVAFAISSIIGCAYLWKKHWILNNLFGLSFALNGVELLHLNTMVIGCTLLGGLFLYDIFWVFGTDVMVTVAKSFEAPIKLVFPQDIFENWLDGKNFAMLGLGDIVIPGVFIALLLRFDYSLQRRSKLYFYTSFFAYFLGLVMTICVMAYFKHAQPALLYLVPVCIGTPLLIATLKGDTEALFKYEDHPKKEEENQCEGEAKSSSQTDLPDKSSSSEGASTDQEVSTEPKKKK